MTAYIHEKYENEKFFKLNPVDNCFFCGMLLKNDEKDIGGIVMWAGYSGIIALHQCCAEQLGIHLIQDARSLVSITGLNNKLLPGGKRDMKHLWHHVGNIEK
jgi:hypothetical protein